VQWQYESGTPAKFQKMSMKPLGGLGDKRKPLGGLGNKRKLPLGIRGKHWGAWGIKETPLRDKRVSVSRGVLVSRGVSVSRGVNTASLSHAESRVGCQKCSKTKFFDVFMSK
jgi:hypothetical protein